MKKLVLATILFSSIAGGCTTQPEPATQVEKSEYQRLDVYYSHSTKEGLFFTEPKAETDNNVFVPYESWSEWVGTKPDTLQKGEKFTGVFDNEGIELLDIIK